MRKLLFALLLGLLAATIGGSILLASNPIPCPLGCKWSAAKQKCVDANGFTCAAAPCPR